MNIIEIDGALCASRDDFWDNYVRQIEPDNAEGFGRNLDAFNDALAGGPGFPGVAKFVFLNSELLKKALVDGYFDSIVETINKWPEYLIEYKDRL